MKKIMMLLIGVTMLASMAAASDPLGLNLPPNPVTLMITGFASDAYVNVKLSNVLGGYDVSNGVYKGWCANPYRYIWIGSSYDTTLYSSYDTNLPSYAQNDDWDKVNYLVNRYRSGAYGTCTANDVQLAIWDYFVIPSDTPYTHVGYLNPNYGYTVACVNTILTDANNNGDGFIPGSGDIVGVVCDNGDKVQVIFIEIFYFPAPELMGAILVMALVSPAFIYLVIKKRRD